MQCCSRSCAVQLSAVVLFFFSNGEISPFFLLKTVNKNPTISALLCWLKALLTLGLYNVGTLLVFVRFKKDNFIHHNLLGL
jgi:hypothetical protein